jgi:hypothetical protein
MILYRHHPVATPNINTTVWLSKHLWILYIHTAGAFDSFVGMIAIINMHGSEFHARKCICEMSADAILKLDLISGRIMGHSCLSYSWASSPSSAEMRSRLRWGIIQRRKNVSKPFAGASVSRSMGLGWAFRRTQVRVEGCATG